MRAARVTALMGVLAVAGGCAAEPAAPTLPETLPTDVPYAYQASLDDPGGSGLLVGTLELQDDCLVVIPEGGGDPVVPVLPLATTSWDGTTLTVNDLPSELGEPTMLPGDGAATADADWFLPPTCPAGEAGAVDPYFLVNLDVGD